MRSRAEQLQAAGQISTVVLAGLLFCGCGNPAANAGSASAGREASARPAPGTSAPRTTAGAPAPGTAAPAPLRARAAVLGILSRSPSDTIRLSPEEPPPVSTASYPSLEAACDGVEAIVRGATRSVSGLEVAKRAPTTFQYRYAGVEGPGVLFQLDASDSCPFDAIEDGLRAAGWVENWHYSSDGPDGSTLGFVSREFLCYLEGVWDGGDDSDTTYVPKPGCHVRITCAPRRSDDVPK